MALEVQSGEVVYLDLLERSTDFCDRASLWVNRASENAYSSFKAIIANRFKKKRKI